MKCELCHKTASHTYELAGRILQLCDRCFDRYEIQDAYEEKLFEIENLIENQRYEEALGVLQEILATNYQRDHDGWLENSILSHQALILSQQGKLDEALEKYRNRAKKEFADSSEFMVNQLAIANALIQADRPEEAISELEQGLNAAQGAFLPTALSLFVAYARICEQKDWIVPLSYKTLLRDVIRWYGISIPSNFLQNSTSLTSEILLVDRLHREAQERYRSLQQQLHNLQREKVVKQQSGVKILTSYAESESVEFYQRMALRELEKYLGKPL